MENDSIIQDIKALRQEEKTGITSKQPPESFFGGNKASVIIGVALSVLVSGIVGFYLGLNNSSKH